MAQFSDNVISKAKVALGLPNRYRGNSTPFTQLYWRRTLQHVAENSRTPVYKKTIAKAIKRFEYFLKLR